MTARPPAFGRDARPGPGHCDQQSPPADRDSRADAQDPHDRLAAHLSALGMGFPPRPELVDLLRRLFSDEEAEVAVLLPTGVAPLEVVPLRRLVIALPQQREGAGLPGAGTDVVSILERLVERGLVYTGVTPGGERGYGLIQVGFGFPQTFFWDGGNSPEAATMADLVIRYFNREVTREAYGATPTKPYRYVPVEAGLHEGVQAVLPAHAMRPIVEQAERFALAHCPCRVALRLRGRACDHPEDVCMKFDDLADYLIERGLGREIDREEAWDVVVRSEAAGLVHFVDNAESGVKHNCNCCGCACWNVGSIRRRKTPRDVLMATYFLRTTDLDACTGCGRCAEVCPVAALAMQPRATGQEARSTAYSATVGSKGGAQVGPQGEGRRVPMGAVVDEAWCIGCGVCMPHCPSGAAGLRPRPDVSLDLAPDFATLHHRILDERAISDREAGTPRQPPR